MAPTFSQRIKLPLLGIGSIIFVFLALVFAHHHRTIELPQASEGETLCAVPAEAPRLLENAFGDYFQCVATHTDLWFEAYPDEVAHLEEIYEALKRGRSHDLRGSGAAARFVEHHPTRFQTHSLSLTADEVNDNLPAEVGPPAEVAGEFQRFFVDHDEERLFLTS